VFDAGREPHIAGLLLQPSILVPILGLAVLAMIPVAYRWWKGRQAARGRDG
jgi:hypothetical protein